MQEIWKAIPGYEGFYEVSNVGNIRSVERVEKFMNSTRKRKGMMIKPMIKHVYFSVELQKDGKKFTALNHRMVAIAFIPNPNNLPHVNHIDNDPFNNHVSNLEWVTPKDNVSHAVKQNRHVKGITHGMCKITEDDVRFIRAQTTGIEKLAERFGLTYCAIKYIRRRKTWKHVI